MNNNLIGVHPIVLSELNGKIYINTTTQIDYGVKDTFAIYKNDDQALTSTGLSLTWNEELETLSASRIEDVEWIKAEDGYFNGSVNTTTVLCTHIESKGVVAANLIESNSIHNSDYFKTQKGVVQKWLGFESKKDPSDSPYKISMGVNPENNEEILCFKSSDTKETESKLMFAIDSERVHFRSIINIFNNTTIEDPKGTKLDKKGDVAVDKNYLYYCVADYDGTSKIWKRSALEEW